jgi:hypothetical protein
LAFGGWGGSIVAIGAPKLPRPRRIEAKAPVHAATCSVFARYRLPSFDASNG